LAIPFNAKAKEGAQVLVNFLMSPYAQARKQNPVYWGNSTVLDIEKLNLKERSYFTSLRLGIATLSPKNLGNTLLEPHPSWVNALEKTWSKRYAIGK
jgi:putative thiamine transport system substrate-binding protein